MDRQPAWTSRRGRGSERPEPWLHGAIAARVSSFTSASTTGCLSSARDGASPDRPSSVHGARASSSREVSKRRRTRVLRADRGNRAGPYSISPRPAGTGGRRHGSATRRRSRVRIRVTEAWWPAPTASHGACEIVALVGAGSRLHPAAALRRTFGAPIADFPWLAAPIDHAAMVAKRRLPVALQQSTEQLEPLACPLPARREVVLRFFLGSKCLLHAAHRAPTASI